MSQQQFQVRNINFGFGHEVTAYLNTKKVFVILGYMAQNGMLKDYNVRINYRANKPWSIIEFVCMSHYPNAIKDIVPYLADIGKDLTLTVKQGMKGYEINCECGVLKEWELDEGAC